jgi:putative hydroxymethylpyrimidine transport system permease protein
MKTGRSLRRSFSALLSTLALFGLWEGYVRLSGTPPQILPAPSAVLKAVWTYRDLLFRVHLPVTLQEVLIGFALSFILGALLGLAIYLWRPLELTLYPLIVASQTVPTIAISPVFLWWFGYTLQQKVAVVVLITFFPIAIGLYDGLKAADRDQIELLRSMGASRWQILRLAEWPAALPSLLTATKLAGAAAVVGATIGEWLGGEAGLGYFGRRMNTQWKVDALFASVLLLSLLGIALVLLVTWLERRLLRWRPESDSNA